MQDQELNRYWKKIIDTMNDGLILVSPDGTILMVNQAFERLTGFTSEEIVGRPCTILNCDACEITLQKGRKKWCSLFERGRDRLEIETRSLYPNILLTLIDNTNGACLGIDA